MHVVLVGCGRVGASVATALAADEHDVVIIDRDPGAFANLGSAFNGMTMAGTGIDVEVLRRAGIEKADAFAAVTSHDNVNLMASQIARRIFQVPKVVARVNDPRKRDAYNEFEVETFSPTDLGATHLRRIIEAQEFRVLQSLGAGEVVTLRLRVGDGLAGRTVGEMELPEKLRVICMDRGGVVQIPRADVTLQREDSLVLSARRDALDWLRTICREEDRG